jgi:hypothetical protein
MPSEPEIKSFRKFLDKFIKDEDFLKIVVKDGSRLNERKADKFKNLIKRLVDIGVMVNSISGEIFIKNSQITNMASFKSLVKKLKELHTANPNLLINGAFYLDYFTDRVIDRDSEIREGIAERDEERKSSTEQSNKAKSKVKSALKASKLKTATEELSDIQAQIDVQQSENVAKQSEILVVEEKIAEANVDQVVIEDADLQIPEPIVAKAISEATEGAAILTRPNNIPVSETSLTPAVVDSPVVVTKTNIELEVAADTVIKQASLVEQGNADVDALLAASSSLPMELKDIPTGISKELRAKVNQARKKVKKPLIAATINNKTASLVLDEFKEESVVLTTRLSEVIRILNSITEPIINDGLLENVITDESPEASDIKDVVNIISDEIDTNGLSDGNVANIARLFEIVSFDTRSVITDVLRNTIEEADISSITLLPTRVLSRTFMRLVSRMLYSGTDVFNNNGSEENVEAFLESGERLGGRNRSNVNRLISALQIVIPRPPIVPRTVIQRPSRVPQIATSLTDDELTLIMRRTNDENPSRSDLIRVFRKVFKQMFGRLPTRLEFNRAIELSQFSNFDETADSVELNLVLNDKFTNMRQEIDEREREEQEVNRDLFEQQFTESEQEQEEKEWESTYTQTVLAAAARAAAVASSARDEMEIFRQEMVNTVKNSPIPARFTGPEARAAAARVARIAMVPFQRNRFARGMNPIALLAALTGTILTIIAGVAFRGFGDEPKSSDKLVTREATRDRQGRPAGESFEFSKGEQKKVDEEEIDTPQGRPLLRPSFFQLGTDYIDNTMDTPIVDQNSEWAMFDNVSMDRQNNIIRDNELGQGLMFREPMFMPKYQKPLRQPTRQTRIMTRDRLMPSIQINQEFTPKFDGAITKYNRMSKTIPTDPFARSWEDNILYNPI